MENNKFFYKNLNSFQDFSELTNNSRFIAIPDSWNIVITDIKGSTKAVIEGRYKDVNLIGAASITCAFNISGENEVPFVFGGDGATLLISDDLLPALINELHGLQKLALHSFQLNLRVGYVSMKELRKNGNDLFVAKYELSPGNYTAQFKGKAINIAEDMIKKGTPAGAIMLEQNVLSAPPVLEGLSCRLTPLTNQKGIILTILVKPTKSDSDDSLLEVLTGLKIILNGDFLSARPVSLDRLSWHWPSESFWAEVKTQKRINSYLKQVLITGLQVFISAIMLTFNISIGAFQPRKYKKELVTNSDYKKYDETLRMVIDCSIDQSEEIERFFQKLKNENKIYYGIHKSVNALMTCFVKSASSNKHIHFIDGADGGYTLASIKLKEQTMNGNI